MKCPICNSEEAESATECHRCKWKFRYFLSMSPEEKDLYRAMMDEARKEWKKKLIDELPPFKRGVFETKEEFKERIESRNHEAGKATLSEELYDADNSVYPIRIAWDSWVNQFEPENTGLYITAERDNAKSLSGKEFPVSVTLSVNAATEKISISHIVLAISDKYLTVNQNESKNNFGVAVDDKWKFGISLSDAVAGQISSENIVPDLRRGIYEKKVEFADRIKNDGKSYFAGTAVLLKNRYDVDKTDYATGLMWQKSGSDNYMNYEKAQAYIRELNGRKFFLFGGKKFAGYDDWRLPTVDELTSLLEPDKQSNSLYINPIFDSKQPWCWTSDHCESGGAWLVGFRSGHVGWYNDDTMSLTFVSHSDIVGHSGIRVIRSFYIITGI